MKTTGKMSLCLLMLIFLRMPAPAYMQVPCIMHIHSTFSNSGRLTLEQIIQKARNNNINVVIPTDHDLEKVDYGIWPFRKILKKTVQRNSVFLTGTEKYLGEINRLQEKYPDMVIIPGVESSPYHFWTGSPFKKNLVLHGIYKHMTVIGLDKIEQYNKLPVIGNNKSREFDPMLLWPCVVLLIGVLLKNRFRFYLIITACLLLLYNFPFSSSTIDPYSNQGELPYQNLINYINSQNALIFWAHPEARNGKEYNAGNVTIQSPLYPEAVLETENYTGFAYFWEGANTVGIPGGYWDKTLIQFCSGERKKPVWANGELDYIADGLQNNYLNLNQNILLVNKLSKDEAMDALRKGRFYIVSKNKPGGFDPRIKEFTIKAENSRATFGEKLQRKDKVKTFFNISTSDNKTHNMKIKFIENGMVINTMLKKSSTSGNANIEYEFNPSAGNTYIRIEIDMDNSTRLVTNPVFLYNK